MSNIIEKHKRQNMELNNQVENNILDAAERVFYIKGKDGASMQDIADEANITRTSLNYYYRSKDKLFEAVFRNALSFFIPKVAALMKSSLSLTEYLPQMVSVIIDSFIEKPQIPSFVLQELTSNPDRVPEMMQELGFNPSEVLKIMKEDTVLQNSTIDPRQLIINVLSLCIFPFAGKPMVLSIMYQGDEEAFIDAMNQRKVLIPLMIENMIKSFKQ
ncbi:MAG: helix-turn-helix domain containing protein [Bacteroidales bacterium]|jgi:TetR/AcrR family transcriptional regulator|nr:helix-turn-helix domain containing protein [Bacteroidales bacterium]